MEKEMVLITSKICIKDFGSDKLYPQRSTFNLINKKLGDKNFKVSYFETSNCEEYQTEGTNIEYGNEVFIIDRSYGYISKYLDDSYIPSEFNWPSINLRGLRVEFVSDYLLTGFNINTSEYLEDPKNYQNVEFYHIMKFRYLFDNPNFRLNSDITEDQFQGWVKKQPEFKIIEEEPNKGIEKKLSTPIQDTLSDEVNQFKEFAKDIPLQHDASGSSEDTVRVYKEFDLGNSDWDLDYVYSFRYNSGAYLMKLKTTILGKIECYLMVLHGTQWENVQLNDLLLDIKIDNKKDKGALIETYKKEIMKFIDFFEVV